jgi:hypothetical protein
MGKVFHLFGTNDPGVKSIDQECVSLLSSRFETKSVSVRTAGL